MLCHRNDANRTNRKGKSGSNTQSFTRVEGAFQDLKSEPGLRPIHHQNADRTGAHLFTGVMAYRIFNSIENSLKPMVTRGSGIA